MSIAPRTSHLQALRYWYEASTLAPLHGSLGWFNAYSYYDQKFPTMADAFGREVQRFHIGKVKEAMQTLGKKSGTGYPHRDEFFQALAFHAGAPTVASVVSGASKEIAEDVGDALAFGGKTVVIVAAIAGAAYLLMMSGAPLKLLKGRA